MLSIYCSTDAKGQKYLLLDWLLLLRYCARSWSPQVAYVLQNMLASLSNINLQQVASNVIKNGFSDDSDFQEVAHQVRVNRISPPFALQPLHASALLLLAL